MNFPKRTQEIATILCHPQLLDGDTELSRKIVGHLKDAETEWHRSWHIHRYHSLLATSGLDRLPHEEGYVFSQFYHRFISFLTEVLRDLKEDSYHPVYRARNSQAESDELRERFENIELRNQHRRYIIKFWNEEVAEVENLGRDPPLI
jgi:hypothetical protein